MLSILYYHLIYTIRDLKSLVQHLSDLNRVVGVRHEDKGLAQRLGAGARERLLERGRGKHFQQGWQLLTHVVAFKCLQIISNQQLFKILLVY